MKESKKIKKYLYITTEMKKQRKLKVNVIFVRFEGSRNIEHRGEKLETREIIDTILMLRSARILGEQSKWSEEICCLSDFNESVIYGEDQQNADASSG